VAKTYHLGRARQLVNNAMTPLARLGLAGRHTYVLTVRGRKTGKSHSIPVILIEDEQRWLVAPYGEVGWVRNARAAREVQLTRAGRSERAALDEVGAEQAAPILRRYLRRVPVVRPFFDVSPNSPLAEFEAEAGRHPVFRLTDFSDAAVDSQDSSPTAGWPTEHPDPKNP
jgi:deazaflavin-dependent oxidoreductase (nitroreductase family)